MPGVELGARYKAGRGGARVLFRDGSVVQLAPFTHITFEQLPRQIEGRLYRVTQGASSLGYEAPALEPQEQK